MTRKANFGRKQRCIYHNIRFPTADDPTARRNVMGILFLAPPPRRTQARRCRPTVREMEDPDHGSDEHGTRQTGPAVPCADCNESP
jgi:hypothetical protein